MINYTPDHAVLFDLKGNPLEVLSKAYRLGNGSLIIGGHRIDPQRVQRFLWDVGDLEFLPSGS